MSPSTTNDEPTRTVANTVLAYDRLAPKYAQTWFSDRSMDQLLTEFLAAISDPPDVLDVGCGPGRDVLAMQKRGIAVVGIDLSVGMLMEARSRVPDGTFRRLDLRNIPYPDSTFSGIWACASFHHVEPPHNLLALRQFYRVLTFDGVLALVVREGYGELKDDLGRYIRLYQVDELRDLLTATGFSILKQTVSTSSKGTRSSAKTKTWLEVLAQKTTPAAQSEHPSTGCPFCPNDRFHLRRCLGLPGPGSVLLANPEAFIFPDVAPLMIGHMLVVTGKHYLNIGTLHPPTLSSVLELQRHVSHFYQDVYGVAGVFCEHGPQRSGEAGSCIDHAHLHCLPLDRRLVDSVEQILTPGVSALLEELPGTVPLDKSYIYFQHGLETGRLYTAAVLPSQFCRQATAALLGLSSWRWQDRMRQKEASEAYAQTVHQFADYLDRVRSCAM